MDNCFAAKRFFPSCLFCFALLISQLTKLFTLIGKTWSLVLSNEIRLCPLYLFFHTQFFALFDFQWAWTHVWVRFKTQGASAFVLWWRWWESNPWPPACRAGALPAELHPHIGFFGHWKLNNKSSFLSERISLFQGFVLVYFQTTKITLMISTFSIERRWSSRTFRYGYLVTT